MEAKAEPQRVDEAAHSQLGLGVALADAAHVCAAFRWG